MQKRYVIVKKYDAEGVRYNDRMYFSAFDEPFTGCIKKAAKYHNKDTAHFALERIRENGVFQLEKIYIKSEP